MADKINDAAGFAEMAAAAPRTEFDDLSTTVGALSNNVGTLSVELDELKRRLEGPGEAYIARTLLEHGQRLLAIENHLKQQMQDTSVQREALERNTRSSALDHATKASPEGLAHSDFDAYMRVYHGMLGILRGNV